MKYQANPVRVEAFKIVGVSPGNDGDVHVALEDGSTKLATLEMCARMEPKVGDYWVIQADGYIYLNPKEVFERKYHPVQAKS
jgi:hypothetical protein